MAYAERFEELQAWQVARKLAAGIYAFTREDRVARDVRFCSQIQAAAVAVMSNIAKGFESQSRATFIKHLYVAKESAGEVRNQLYVALDQKYVTQEQFDGLYQDAISASRLIAGLIRKLKEQGEKVEGRQVESRRIVRENAPDYAVDDPDDSFALDLNDPDLSTFHLPLSTFQLPPSTSGFTVWFTGLSGAGKTTISKLVAEELRRRGFKVEVLDGDVVRTNLSKGLGFSKEDRDTNIRRIGWVCEVLTRNDVVAIGAAISPYREIRDELRAKIGRFVEVYVTAPLEVLAERDVKGLYKKALAGEIKGFTGVDDPYEPPLNPEVICYTDGRETPEQSAARVLAKLQELGYVRNEAIG